MRATPVSFAAVLSIAVGLGGALWSVARAQSTPQTEPAPAAIQSSSGLTQ